MWMSTVERQSKEHGAFLASATGLPKLAVQNDLLGHVLELENQLDAYARGDHIKSTALYREAYQPPRSPSKRTCVGHCSESDLEDASNLPRRRRAPPPPDPGSKQAAGVRSRGR